MSKENKQSVYLASSTWQEIKDHAKRLDRSVSWIIHFAWRHAREEIAKLQSVENK